MRALGSSDDARIREFAATPLSWVKIAPEFGVSRSVLTEYAKSAGIPTSRAQRAALRLEATPKPTVSSNPQRDPLPPGHPETWHLITALMPSLQGAEYPR